MKKIKLPAFLAVIIASLFLCLFTTARGVLASDSHEVDSLLASMTLEEKVGQTLLVFFQGPTMSPQLQDLIEKAHVGGIMLYANVGNVETPAQVAKLVADAQALATPKGRGVGLFIAIDQEGGPVARLRKGFAVPPSNMTIGATADPASAAIAARVISEQLSTLGINMSFAPVADVNSNPNNPIIGVRSYGEKTEAVAANVVQAVLQYRRSNIISSAKHFPGHGDTGFDSHVRLPTVPHSLKRLRSVEFPPFQAAIAAGVPAIMTAHVEVPALEPSKNLPATMSSRVLQDVLRDQMGFKGLILTDSLGMGAIDKLYGPQEAGLRAFKAGADVLLYGADKEHKPEEAHAAYKRLLSAVRQGEVSEKRLDESVRRILKLKLEYGLVDSGISLATAPPAVGTPAQTQAVNQLAARGLTLIRDRNNILPLDASSRILMVWPKGPRDAIATQAKTRGIDVLTLPRDPKPEERAKAVAKTASYDAIILPTWRAHRYRGQAKLIQELLAVAPGKPLIGIAMDVPYDAGLVPESPCWIATYSDVPASAKAALDVLLGEQSPKGALPVTIP